MQEFSVKFSALNTGKADLDRIAAALSSYSGQVSSVKGKMNYQLKSKAGIERSLAAVSTNLSGLASKLGTFGEKLSETCKRYEETENQLLSVTSNNTPQDQKSSDSGNGDDAVDASSLIERLYEQFKGVFKGIDKIFDDRDSAVAAALISYIKSLYSLISGENENPTDIWSDWFKLFDESTGLENGLYKYFEKGMNPFDAEGFNKKFGPMMMYLSVIGDLFGFVGDGLDLKSVYDDPNSSVYDVRSKLIKLWGSGFKTIGNTYIATEFGKKSIRLVTEKGASKLPKLKFAVSPEMASKAKKGATYLAIADVAVSTIAGGYEKYGECIQDGEIDGADVGSIGTRAACDGISSVVSGLSFGVVKVDGEQFANNLEDRVDAFVQEGGSLQEYIGDKSNPVVLRFLAAEGVAAEIIAREAADGVKNATKKVVDGSKEVASWLKSKWNAIVH